MRKRKLIKSRKSLTVLDLDFKKKLLEKTKTGELKIEVIDWASEGPEAKPLWSETKAYALSALDSKKLWWKRVDKVLRDAGGVDASRAFVRVSAKAASVGDGAAAAAAIARTNAAIEAMLAKDALAVSLEDQRGAAAEEVAAAEAAAAVVSSAAASATKTASSSSSSAASSTSSSLSPAAKAAVDALISHAATKGGSLPPEMLTQSFLAKASRRSAAASAAVAEAAEKSDRAAANELRLAARDAAAAAADAAMAASADGPDADAAALAAAAASIAAYEAKQNSNNLTAPPPADVVGAPAPAKAPSPPASAPLPPRLVALMSSSEARAAAAKGARPPAADSPSGSGWVSSSFIWLTEPKDAAINPRPKLTATDFVQVSPNTVSFKLSSKGVAPYVALDTSFDGVFDDNNLLMVPWEPRTLTFTGRSGAAVDAAAFAKSLGVLSLADTLDEVSTIYMKPSSVN